MPEQNIKELTNGEFEKYIEKGIVVIDFFAEWCMPCLMMEPIIEDLAETFTGKVKFGKVNVGDNQTLAQKFKIISIPNFIIFKNGKQAGQFIGSMSAEDFGEKLKGYL
ncbi:MAG: thioredoxin [Nanoarchaeota archaeon]